MAEAEMFPRAPEAVQLSAYWDFYSGWEFRIATRLNGHAWMDAQVRTYEGLSSEELLDVAGLELARTLGIRD